MDSSEETEDDEDFYGGGDGPVVVNQNMDMPEGATLSDGSLSSRSGAIDDPHRALNIDLDT